jgi:hypothetical protein
MNPAVSEGNSHLMASTNSASSVDSRTDEGPQKQKLAILKSSHTLRKERNCEGKKPTVYEVCDVFRR